MVGFSFEVLVVQMKVTAQWFRGKELAMSIGVCLSFLRLASVVNDNVEPFFGYQSDESDKESIFLGLIVGAIFCSMSLIVGFLTNCLDIYADKQDHRSGWLASREEENNFSFSNLKKLSCLYYILILNSILSYICIFPFLGVAASYFQVRYGLTEKHSGSVVVIISLCLVYALSSFPFHCALYWLAR